MKKKIGSQGKKTNQPRKVSGKDTPIKLFQKRDKRKNIWIKIV